MLDWALRDWWQGKPYFYRSPGWREKQQSWLAENSRCEACQTTRNLEVHHLVPVHRAPERELDDSNLMTLCRRCHLLIGHGGNFQRWNPHCREDVIWVYRMIQRCLDI